MLVSDAMAKTISTASPGDTLTHVATLMKEEDCGFIPVVDGEELVGCITDRDIVLRAVADTRPEGVNDTAGHVMSRPVWTIQADAPLEDAAEEMARHEVRRLPVVNDRGHLEGVITFGNLEQALHAAGKAAADATLGVTRGA